MTAGLLFADFFPALADFDITFDRPAGFLADFIFEAGFLAEEDFFPIFADDFLVDLGADAFLPEVLFAVAPERFAPELLAEDFAAGFFADVAFLDEAPEKEEAEVLVSVAPDPLPLPLFVAAPNAVPMAPPTMAPIGPPTTAPINAPDAPPATVVGTLTPSLL